MKRDDPKDEDLCLQIPAVVRMALSSWVWESAVASIKDLLQPFLGMFWGWDSSLELLLACYKFHVHTGISWGISGPLGRGSNVFPCENRTIQVGVCHLIQFLCVRILHKGEWRVRVCKHLRGRWGKWDCIQGLYQREPTSWFTLLPTSGWLFIIAASVGDKVVKTLGSTLLDSHFIHTAPVDREMHWMSEMTHPPQSVAQSCLTLCNPTDCSTPGFPVHHQLPQFAQTHVHWVRDAIQPSHLPKLESKILPLWGSNAHRIDSSHFLKKDFFSFFFFSFIFISWRLITSQHCSGFCHTLTWISHGVTCIPHPDPPSHLPLHRIPLGLPSASGPSTCLMHPSWAGDLFHYR